MTLNGSLTNLLVLLWCLHCWTEIIQCRKDEYSTDETPPRFDLSPEATEHPKTQGSEQSSSKSSSDWGRSGEAADKVKDTQTVDSENDLTSESMDEVLEEEELLPEHVMGIGRPSSGPVIYVSHESLLGDFPDASGSGSGEDIDLATKEADGKQFTNSDSADISAIVERTMKKYTTGKYPDDGAGTTDSSVRRTAVTQSPRVDAAIHTSSSSRISKKAKVGLIVGAVLTGAVVIILGSFLFCKLNRKRRKGNITKNAYVPAPQDQAEEGRTKSVDAGITPVLQPTEHVALEDETTPLAGQNGSLASSVGRYEPPIDIANPDVTVDTSLRNVPLRFEYTEEMNHKISNTGTTVQVQFGDKNSELGGGPLGTKLYRLAHCHFHWGSSDKQGSDHTVDGTQYSAEIHFVHWNKSDHTTEAEAARSTRGLAVVAVFVKIGNHHEGLDKITSRLHKICYKGQTANCPDVDGTALLPENRDDYWTFVGSRTQSTDPDSVTWIVFREPIHMSKGQIEEFRKLRAHEQDENHDSNTFLSDNYRRPQAPSCERSITSSFS